MIYSSENIVQPTERITAHYALDRQERDALIREVIGLGDIVDSFEVDRGHEGGAEIHSVTNTGIIIVRNKRNNMLITELIARPQQLRNLYASDNREAPRELLRLAYTYTQAGYNKI